MTHAFALAPPAETADFDDDALVAGVRDDPEAFSAIYQRYLRDVYRYMRARTGNDDEAADLTQAVFLRAFGGLRSYRPGRAPFAAWLFRIARNVAVDAHRRGRGRRTSGLAATAHVADDAAGPDELAVDRERIEELRAVIARLHPKKRDLLELRFAAGLSSREIAAVVGKSEQATKRELTRIIATLKEHYREEQT